MASMIKAAAPKLRQLRRVIRKVPDKKLDMASFRNDCGTACCAASHAARDPWFRAQGLRWSRTEKAPKYTVDGITYYGGQALKRFFGLPDATTDYLFALDFGSVSSSPSPVTKAEVLENIDRLLSGKRALPYEAAAIR